MEENDQLYFVVIVEYIDIKFSLLLQNNLLSVKMLFEIQKPQLTPRLFFFKQHYSTMAVSYTHLTLPTICSV